MHTHKGVLSTEHGTRTQGMHSSHSTKDHTSYIYVYTLILHRMVSCVLQSLGSPLFLNVDAIIVYILDNRMFEEVGVLYVQLDIFA